MSPPFNSHHIRQIAVDEMTLLVNHGRRHRLHKFISNIDDLVDHHQPDFILFEGMPAAPPNAVEDEPVPLIEQER
jgi:hypothetical protein